MFRLLPISIALGLAAPAAATIIAPFDLDDLTTLATDVVRGEVVGIESAWQGRFIWTDVRVEVTDCLKGACAQSELTVRVLGGYADHLMLEVQGFARYDLGEEVVLFLERMPGGRYRTTGLAQGKFTLRHGPEGVVAERESLTLAHRDRQGREVVERLPLGALRLHVDGVLRR